MLKDSLKKNCYQKFGPVCATCFENYGITTWFPSVLSYENVKKNNRGEHEYVSFARSAELASF